MFWTNRKTQLVAAADALPGRTSRMPVRAPHEVLGTSLVAPFPEGSEVGVFGLGCFWGAERLFWTQPGVITTAVGYAGGTTPNPSYEEVCSARTGHTEAVLVVFDPSVTSYERLLQVFFEGHDPTQGMRQGNDVGTQYRSAAYFTSDAQRDTYERYAAAFQEQLRAKGYGEITTDARPLDGPVEGVFFYAEAYHQQYLQKVPNGYCGLGGTGVTCPVGLAGV